MATELTIWPTRSTRGPKGSFSCVIVIIADNKQKFYDKINEENIQLCWHVQSKFLSNGIQTFLETLMLLVPPLLYLSCLILGAHPWGLWIVYRFFELGA